MAKKVEALMAHGMTARQYEELKLRKLSGDVEMIDANHADKLKDALFAKDFEGYKIPQHERFHYHVAQELRLFGQQTGKRESVSAIHTYDKAMWPMIKNSDVFKAYTAEIVHNPEEEDDDAPLVTLKYTLTDEELKTLDGESINQNPEAKSKDNQDQEVKPKGKAKTKTNGEGVNQNPA